MIIRAMVPVYIYMDHAYPVFTHSPEKVASDENKTQRT